MDLAVIYQAVIFQAKCHLSTKVSSIKQGVIFQHTSSHHLSSLNTQDVVSCHLSTHNQTSKQIIKQTSKQASKQANKQTSKQTSKQANNQANNQTIKQSSCQTPTAVNFQVLLPVIFQTDNAKRSRCPSQLYATMFHRDLTLSLVLVFGTAEIWKAWLFISFF